MVFIISSSGFLGTSGLFLILKSSSILLKWQPLAENTAKETPGGGGGWWVGKGGNTTMSIKTEMYE